MESPLLRMGVTGRPHGIKGEIGVDWHGSVIPANGDHVYLQAAGKPPAQWRVASSRIHNGRLLLAFENVNDRTDAEKLKGMAVLLPRDSLPAPDENEAFAQDLPGFSVFLPDGSILGKIDHVEFPAGRMIWAITGTAGQEILFPAEPDFIVSLDTQKRTATIDPPAGLLDIYSA